MTASDTYTTYLFGSWMGADGVPYQVRVRVRDGSITVVGVTGVPTVPSVGGVVLERDAGRSPLGPLAATRMTLRWLDAGASVDLVGLPYGDVVGVLTSDRDGDGTYETTEFAGFLVPGRYEETPGDPLADTVLGFNCGLGLLGTRAAVDTTDAGYDETDEATLAARLDAALTPLASANPFHTVGVDAATGWAPEGTSGEPFEALTCRDAAWTDADRETTARQDYLARTVAGRFNARLWLDGPSAAGGLPTWRVRQRGRLAAGADVADNPAAWDALDLGASAGTPGRDEVVRGARRLSDAAAIAAECHRSFRDPLDDLFVNGSFEDGTGEGTGSTVDGWELDLGERYNLGDYDPDAADRYALALYGRQGEARGGAVQRNQVTATGAPGGSYEFTVVSNAVESGQEDTDGWTLRLDVGAHGVRTMSVRCTAATKGDGVTVECAPVLKGVGAGRADGDAVEGALVAPAGAVLPIGSGSTKGTLRLTEPARVGDTVLVGDLSETQTANQDVEFYYYGPSGSSGSTVEVPKAEVDTFATYHLRMPATDCTGDVVSGAVYVDITGPPVPPAAPSGLYFRHLYQRVTLALLDADGRPAKGAVTRATLAGARGEGAVSLPVADNRGFPIGDGPRPDSAGRLAVAAVPTGPASGVEWEGDHLPGTYETLDALTAADALAQFGVVDHTLGAPRVWSGRLLLRGHTAGGTPPRVPLDRPLTLYHPSGGSLVGALYWWDRHVWDVLAGTVDLEATELRLGDVSAAVVTYELTS